MGEGSLDDRKGSVGQHRKRLHQKGASAGGVCFCVRQESSCLDTGGGSVWKRCRCFGPNVSVPPVIDEGKSVHLLQSSLLFFSGGVQLRDKVLYVSSEKFSVCDVSWIPLKRQQ